MKVLISGGSGFIGNILTGKLMKSGHHVTALTRGIKQGLALTKGSGIIQCDPTVPGQWQEKAAEYEVIINLAGASIFRRWNSKGKQEIIYSRILTTRNLVEALAYRKKRETHFFSISGIGYYGFHRDEVIKESEAPGDDFLAQVAVQWEFAAHGAEQYGARLVLCRLGHVMGLGGSVLPKLIALHKLHLGSRWGSGRQWVSWIHEEDMADTFLFLLAREDVKGPVNITAPNPVRNSEMMKLLAVVLPAKSLILAVPGFLLRLVMGEFATVFLKGQRVAPDRLLNSGFVFKYPTLDEALCELLKPYSVTI